MLAPLQSLVDAGGTVPIFKEPPWARLRAIEEG